MTFDLWFEKKMSLSLFNILCYHLSQQNKLKLTHGNVGYRKSYSKWPWCWSIDLKVYLIISPPSGFEYEMNGMKSRLLTYREATSNYTFLCLSQKQIKLHIVLSTQSHM